MKNYLVSTTLLLACGFIGACASIDYSPANLVPEGAPRAHVVTGIFGDGTGGVYVLAVNKTKADQPVPGREFIIPAGDVTLKLYYFYAKWNNTSDLRSTFEPGKYYIIEGYPHFSAQTITYKTRETTAVDFKSYQCVTQRKIQKNLEGINPQKTPACDGLL